MGVTPTINERRYGALLAKALPRVIESDDELERAAAELEKLDFGGRELSPEEQAVQKLLVRLIRDYDERTTELPGLEPKDALAALMEHQQLRQADLVELIGSRSQVSDILSGRRGISKAVARRLADRFGVSVDLFL